MPEMSVHHALRWTFISIVVVAIAVSAWLLFPRSQSPSVSLPGGGVSVSAITSAADVPVGQTFTVAVALDAGQLSVSAADLVVTYDATLLKATGIKAGTFLPVELAGGNAENGRATITVASGTTPVTGSGTVLTLTFQALAPGQAVIGANTETKVSAVGQSGNVVGAMTPVTVTIH
jgi:general secretion pathway protein D